MDRVALGELTPIHRWNEFAGVSRSVFIEADLVAPPSQVVMQPRQDTAVDRNEGSHQADGDVVGRHVLEGASRQVAIQIVAAWSLPKVIQAGHERKSGGSPFGRT